MLAKATLCANYANYAPSLRSKGLETVNTALIVVLIAQFRTYLLRPNPSWNYIHCRANSNDRGSPFFTLYLQKHAPLLTDVPLPWKQYSTKNDALLVYHIYIYISSFSLYMPTTWFAHKTDRYMAAVDKNIYLSRYLEEVAQLGQSMPPEQGLFDPTRAMTIEVCIMCMCARVLCG